MKRLTLVRHAKAAPAGDHVDDAARPLTARGLRAAAEIGGRLHGPDFHPDAVLTSPAVRAAETAAIVAAEIAFPPTGVTAKEEIYTESAAGLERLVRRFDPAWSHVLLVGHNPTLSDLVERLARAELGELPTAGVADLVLAVDEWERVRPGSGRLLRFDRPVRAVPRD